MHLIYNAKTMILTLLTIAIGVESLYGCNEQVKSSSDLTGDGSPAIADQTAPPKKSAPDNQSTPPDYWGEDWANQKPSSPSSGGSSKNGGTAPSGEAAAPNSMWTLIIGTFSDPGHEDAARQMLIDLPRIAPQISGARVHTTPHGSMVIYGNYTGRDDPKAERDQAWLKSLQFQGHPVFNRVILTRIELTPNQARLHPFDLRAARLAHPKVNPMYTLDVAIWMTNNDPKSRDRITYDEVKKRAEAYAGELRTKGFEAYFHHDDGTQWSIVTVGLFDRRAIEMPSGFFSADVKNLMAKFPARLVNGEPLMELKDPNHPKAGVSPQQPRLVLVPEM